MKRSFSFVVLVHVLFASVIFVPTAHAAKLVDGTAQWSDTTGMTVVFEPQTALAPGDEFTLTFPEEAPVSDSFLFYAPGDEPVTVSGQTFVNFTRNGTDNSVEITIFEAMPANQAVTVELDTRVVTGYDPTVYAQQSVAINSTSSVGGPMDYGVAIITNDNTTEVTATVPLFLTLAVDDVTMDLGTLSVATVKEVAQTYTVNSNNRNGVQVQVTSDGDLRDGNGNTINAVADGEVTAGNEEYGVAVSNMTGGVAADTPYDAGDDALPTVLDDFVHTDNPVANGTFDVTYKAAIDGTTISGEYSQVVTVTVATRA